MLVVGRRGGCCFPIHVGLAPPGLSEGGEGIRQESGSLNFDSWTLLWPVA